MEPVSGLRVCHATGGAVTGWKNLMCSHLWRNLLKVEHSAICITLPSDLFGIKIWLDFLPFAYFFLVLESISIVSSYSAFYLGHEIFLDGQTIHANTYWLIKSFPNALNE